MDPVEITEAPVEKENSPSKSPPSNSKGTPPATSPGPTPPPSPHSKKKAQLANSTSSRKSSKEEKPGRKTSKEEKPTRKTSKDERPSRKVSKDERASTVEPPKPPPPQAAPPRQEEAPPKPPKAPESPPALAPPPQAQAVVSSPANGQLHTQYHSYYVKAPTRGPPPPDLEEGEDEDLSQAALARMAPQPPRSYGASTLKPAPNSKSEPKLRKQDSQKPKSLAEMKKASMDIADAIEVEAGPNSILVAMVMLLNIGLAIIFVHFLT
ncbi:junctophilin-1-like [Hypomesus transpacificus]|uniref:junctophilin-1-like n=1 Tax=Hypomesus transpacificus TaxID=137520 RepID=UPI001F072580|nr:junctophilin-1-like [Hypomesus transpacificus]